MTTIVCIDLYTHIYKLDHVTKLVGDCLYHCTFFVGGDTKKYNLLLILQ